MGLLLLLLGWHSCWARGSRPATKQRVQLALHFPTPSSPLSTLLKVHSSFILWVKVQGPVLPSDKSINFCFWRWNHFVTDMDTLGTQWEEGDGSVYVRHCAELLLYYGTCPWSNLLGRKGQYVWNNEETILAPHGEGLQMARLSWEAP